MRSGEMTFPGAGKMLLLLFHCAGTSRVLAEHLLHYRRQKVDNVVTSGVFIPL